MFIKAVLFIRKVLISFKGKNDFTTSESYWKEHYAKGGNSGAGSYNNLAEFKAEVINAFVEKNNIQTAIELGCGDGNQLKYLKISNYIGFDISPLIIENCKKIFKSDENKQFYTVDKILDHKAAVALSLDVIYHLVEDSVYEDYMKKLFNCSTAYVIIYSNDTDKKENYDPHIKARKFSRWVADNRPDFELIEHIPNKYPLRLWQYNHTSFADFYIYKRKELQKPPH